eukprot:1614411-Amphidinium_carterae.1
MEIFTPFGTFTLSSWHNVLKHLYITYEALDYHPHLPLPCHPADLGIVANDPFKGKADKKTRL